MHLGYNVGFHSFLSFQKELSMTKAEVRTQFTSLLNKITIQHKVNAKHRTREAFVLDRLHQGNISPNRAARLLNVSREDISEFIYKIKLEPPLLTTRS